MLQEEFAMQNMYAMTCHLCPTEYWFGFYLGS